MKRPLSLLLIVSLAWPLGAEEKPATPPRKTVPQRIKGVVPEPIRQVPHEIQKVIKETQPNPKVRSPGTDTMPLEAPPMPEGPRPGTEPLPSGADQFFDAVSKVMTTRWRNHLFVWLPAISTDPNTGPTYGLMPVVVMADQQTRHIRHLMAPSVTYNRLFGTTGTMRYYYYPTDKSQLFSVASYSKNTNRELKVRYENASAFDDVVYLRGEAQHSIDGSRRFYGIGPDSRESDEAGYAFRKSGGRADAGVNFLQYLRATMGLRIMSQQTRHNIIPDTPDIETAFPGTPGLEQQQTNSYQWRLVFDSRDIPVTPSRGTSGELFLEKTSHGLGSDADFFRHVVEGKHFIPWSDRQTTVVRGLYERVIGPNAPFYERAALGGRGSLRGFGEGRFVDTGRIVANLEQRMTFASVKLMGIETNFEAAPFMDVGTVFPHLDQMQSRDLQFVGGVGFRAAVKPNVVGDVEIGVGREGPAVFVDINYPF